jgi:hypothetical protein
VTAGTAPVLQFCIIHRKAREEVTAVTAPVLQFCIIHRKAREEVMLEQHQYCSSVLSTERLERR